LVVIHHLFTRQLFQKLPSALSCVVILAPVSVSSISINPPADSPDRYLVGSSTNPVANRKPVRYAPNRHSTTLGAAGLPMKFNFAGGES
jgi:hypothetical protein